MIGNRLTNWFSGVAEQILTAMTSNSQDCMEVNMQEEEEDWRPADTVVPGVISMYCCEAKKKAGIYYTQYDFPPDGLVESYYNRIH
ncbi:MAG TPA: hypothetical protein PLD88_09770, partial [Candidatus Berkiella sp.]|nr:hypothetical protein [Candidatus Berkiella sp.]